MNNDAKEKILVYDIECKTVDGQPNPGKDEFRAFGCYTYLTGEYYFFTDLSLVKEVIEDHDYLIGFNNLSYDNMVLTRYFDGVFNLGLHYKYNTPQAFFKFKYNLDLLQIFAKRAKVIITGGEVLDDVLLRYDLDSISKAIGVVRNGRGKIKDFDYSILTKTFWTAEEEQKIREYTFRDVELIKALYEWLETYFESFKSFVSERDVKNKAYLKCTPSAFAYKSLCKELRLKEEYDDVEQEASYGGGYVSYPAGESFDDSQGDIYLLDFNSLYPHIHFQCNLFSPSTTGWNGNTAFKTKGTYDDNYQGRVEKFLLSMYMKRQEYKKNNDPREFALKLIMNSIYGLSSSKRFKHVYRPHTARDCTAIGRQWIQLARKRFRQAGYVNIFSDTDSVFILDKYRDKQRLLRVKDEIIKEIKANVPFPSHSFDMTIEDEITNIWFFKAKQKKSAEDRYMDEDDYVNKKKGLLKKNYIYLTKQGLLKIKNLGVRKKSVSMLTRHIFWKILVPKIKREKKVKFSKEFFVETIDQLLEKDLSLAAIRYNVNSFEVYKRESQLQAQIAKKYGAGIHFLIPNKRYGVGKKKRYCTIQEFKQKGLNVHDIDLDNVWQELEYFIEKQQLTLQILHLLSSLYKKITLLTTKLKLE